ncbi:MAG: phosphatase PAP2 family protein [Clostridia bacterium]|nr:phosphatase PAP2 family protein [Clostridia bacterium]
MEQKLLKKYRPEAVIYLVLTAAALIVAYFRDLQMDIALNNTSNLVANWFAATGEMPASVLLTVAGAFLTKCFQKKWQKVVFGILTVAAGGYLGDFISRRLFEENDFSFGFGIIFGVGIALVFLFTLKFIDIPKKYRRPLIAMAFIGIAVMALQAGIITLMKTFWGRVRFRDLDADYSRFTNWLTVNGNTGDHSFPSGHTAGAGVSYLIMFLPYISKKLQRNRPLCFGAAFCYTTAVAITRLVMGAHYLSDVAVGGLVSFILTLIGMKIYEALAAKDFTLRKRK